ncbi:hypothetical protein [Roseibium limicola]|uniref:Uncharacterized protein n=1 Tax=Roseibium limicola TaxID=2816037 RepID=A0A939EQT1_9HYPH|nr:hypothetical protein [Roseibium limicola]MBO0346813.1 hypothetical protein [Roseibium limicola]
MTIENMPNLTRLTTEYHPEEDRIRISGLDRNEDVHVIWFTRRLCDLLIGEMVTRLRQDGPNAERDAFNFEEDLLQGFAQQKAEAGLEPSQKISAPASSEGWLCTSIDIQKPETATVLIFKSDKVAITPNVGFGPVELRQWLSILRSCYETANWPMTVWPEWILEAKKTASPAATPTILH